MALDNDPFRQQNFLPVQKLASPRKFELTQYGEDSSLVDNPTKSSFEIDRIKLLHDRIRVLEAKFAGNDIEIVSEINSCNQEIFALFKSQENITVLTGQLDTKIKKNRSILAGALTCGVAATLISVLLVLQNLEIDEIKTKIAILDSRLSNARLTFTNATNPVSHTELFDLSKPYEEGYCAEQNQVAHGFKNSNENWALDQWKCVSIGLSVPSK